MFAESSIQMSVVGVPLLLVVLLLYSSAANGSPAFGTGALNFSSPAPHIFASVFGLAQQWPNTFFPWGHTIVPCQVPIGTNLYHARIDADKPTSPEWFGFDAAMSYSIAGTTSTSHLLTYRTTRDVQCIYFDGASASLNGAANMDTQMVLIYNNSANVPDDPPFGRRPPSNNRTSGDPNGPMLGAEYDRAEALCEYIRRNDLGGRGWGFEGIVRMNAGFEMIWCDFESPSARLVSHLNVSVPSLSKMEDHVVSPRTEHERQAQQQVIAMDEERRPRPGPGPGPGPGPRPPSRERQFDKSAQVGWLTASANQYGFAGGVPGRGETRVKIDSCGIFSFFDPMLQDQELARVEPERTRLNITNSGHWQSPRSEKDREQALQQLTRRRRAYRVNDVSEADSAYMQGAIQDRLRAFLRPESGRCSGTDWHRASQEVVLAYSNSLRDLLSLSRSAQTDVKGGEHLRKSLQSQREMLRLLVMPFWQYPRQSAIDSSPKQAFGLSSPEAQDAFTRCRDQITALSPDEVPEAETVIYSAMAAVLGAICTTTITTFLSVETRWFDSYDRHAAHTTEELSTAARKWTYDLEELMAWLGWADQWTGCDPGCSPSEMCWIPMWPLSFMTRPTTGAEGMTEEPPRGPPDGGPGKPQWPGHGYGPGHGGRHGGPPGFGREDESLLWEPRCVNRTQMLVDDS